MKRIYVKSLLKHDNPSICPFKPVQWMACTDTCIHCYCKWTSGEKVRFSPLATNSSIQTDGMMKIFRMTWWSIRFSLIWYEQSEFFLLNMLEFLNAGKKTSLPFFIIRRNSAIRKRNRDPRNPMQRIVLNFYWKLLQIRWFFQQYVEQTNRSNVGVSVVLCLFK